MFKIQGLFRVVAVGLTLLSSLTVSRAQLFVADQNRGTVGEYTTSGITNTNALLSNLSIERGKVVNWNPDEMKLI